ncbi:unnamed protein product [Zymoseptoria tritici ST99CH_1A5]|uniref:Insulin-induced protein n=4 Tax=Zymoseptoria tritici TaxID=1047171 RepID=A0A1X7RYV2_ZYMT9|nr:unnamed protein product [Zymoseptoria tritici ST99CH_3D7]SMR55265.1 unnamed protein product [Zymoseptoria tritici ST99CH_1E4]SMR57639.1 unnamed protein product [Zymoseptoria tritici ST99CH_3D1]SMY26077.1 unnamed protein product [Zymoseptoria tritici ST99CH_1A5]
MSHPATHEDEDEDEIVLKPRPRRPFELSSGPPTPTGGDAPLLPSSLDTSFNKSTTDTSTTPSRSRSFLNLTTSTLFGIYQPAGFGTETSNPTPWGDGAQTPADGRPSFDFARGSPSDPTFERGKDGKIKRRDTNAHLNRPHVRRTGFKGYLLPLIGRLVALFSVGVLYGLLISHLHDRQRIAPVSVNLDRGSWLYLAFWGTAAMVFGEALPLADVFWAPDEDSIVDDSEKEQRKARGTGGWQDIVRSIGAFVGLAFAIRKLPWQSTLQLSLTLALVNPALWYLIDRSPPGLILSGLVSVGGTAIILGINPALVPSPSPIELLQGHVGKRGLVNGTVNALQDEGHVLGIFSHETVGVATWIASVLFVSAVCFGNIGRQLAPQKA